MITSAEIDAQETERHLQIDAEVDALLDARGEFYRRELATRLVEADPRLWIDLRSAMLFARSWLKAALERDELSSELRFVKRIRRYYRRAWTEGLET